MEVLDQKTPKELSSLIPKAHLDHVPACFSLPQTIWTFPLFHSLFVLLAMPGSQSLSLLTLVVSRLTTEIWNQDSDI